MEFTTRYRSRFVIRAIRPWVAPGSTLLDIGCGNGVMSSEIQARLGCRLTGTDILDYARGRIDFRLISNGKTLQARDKSFDAALFVESLHHMAPGIQKALVQEAIRVAGRVLIFEVEPNPFLKAFDYGINQIHNPRMPLTYTFRKKEDWVRFLESQGVPCQVFSVPRPFLGFWFTYHLFVL